MNGASMRENRIARLNISFAGESRPRKFQRGSEREDRAYQHCEQDSADDRAPTHGDVEPARQQIGESSMQKRHDGRPQERGNESADCAEHQGLANDLARQAPHRGAHRRTNANFTTAPNATRENQPSVIHDRQ